MTAGAEDNSSAPESELRPMDSAIKEKRLAVGAGALSGSHFQSPPTIQNYDEEKRCRDSKVHPRRGTAPNPVLESENEKYAAGHRQANDAENLDNRNFLR